MQYLLRLTRCHWKCLGGGIDGKEVIDVLTHSYKQITVVCDESIWSCKFSVPSFLLIIFDISAPAGLPSPVCFAIISFIFTTDCNFSLFVLKFITLKWTLSYGSFFFISSDRSSGAVNILPFPQLTFSHDHATYAARDRGAFQKTLYRIT